MPEKNTKKIKVFVGLSGGVDSSVSAALLKQATPNNFAKLFGRPTPKGFRGYDVIGVFIKTWQPNFIECTWRDDRRDAIRVAAQLDIPFITLDLEKEYKKDVADYMISEYRKGRIPNPDVMCNREIKFGAFWKWAKKNGADYIATGHYAQISEKGPTLDLQKGRSLGRNLNEFPISNFQFPKNSLSAISYQLKAGIDPSKDQSYFLWTLGQKDLEHVLFPLGHLKKTDVRKIAKKFSLPTALKKDSQGICMLGNLDVKDFLGHYIKPQKGNVLNETGEIIGKHSGAVFLTLGERHGFTISKKGAHDSRYYIIAKDIKKNTITVSHAIDEHTHSYLKSEIKIENCNWISGSPVSYQLSAKSYFTAQIRYHGMQEKCEIVEIHKKEAIISFKNPQLVSSGQSVVIYDGAICIGGGILA